MDVNLNSQKITHEKKENESVQKIEFLNVENKELREKLEQILYSKSYKFMQRIKKIIKRG